MNDIFNPSLLISLGPTARRSLEFSRKQLAYLPKHFLNLIGFYNVDISLDTKLSNNTNVNEGKNTDINEDENLDRNVDSNVDNRANSNIDNNVNINSDSKTDNNATINLDKFCREVQQIIDTQLLAAKYLNKLVDLGYKVRSENISSVKINIYLFWDVCDTSYSAYEVLKRLFALSYGNGNKDQHTGVTLFILAIMEKDGSLEEDAGIKAINLLKQVIDYLSVKDNMMRIDSKVFILHCISNDGTRIPKVELEYICSTIAYLNLLPSQDPPLSHFNHRLLMNEGAYKVGTIGISSITVLKDRLLEEFSSCMAADILKHLCEYVTLKDYHDCLSFKLLRYESEKKAIIKDIQISESQVYPINITEKLHKKMSSDRDDFLSTVLAWQKHINQQHLVGSKQNVDEEIEQYRAEIINSFHKDLSGIICENSFKEGIRYLNKLEAEIKGKELKNKSNSIREIPDLSKELEDQVKDYPNAIGFAVKALILAAFLLYSINNLILPHLKDPFTTIFIVIFIILFFIITIVDYKVCINKFSTFINKYKDEILEHSSEATNFYIDKKLMELHKEVLVYFANIKEILLKGIANSKSIMESIAPRETEDNLGNLITDLLDFQDRQRYYREKAPKAANMYMAFLKEVPDYEEFEKQTLEHKLLQFTSKVSRTYLNYEFYDYMVFKFKEDVDYEVLKWIDKGTVKSKYLLQFMNEDTLEEHSFLITTPEIFKSSRDIISKKLEDFNISIVSDTEVNANNISVLRLCLGINLDNIFSTQKIRGRDKDA